MIRANILRTLAPFADLSDPAIQALAPAALDLTFDPDQVLFRAGSRPRGWYVLVSGSVRVVGGRGVRQHVIHTEHVGGTLGEVPLFAGGTHPATGIAHEPTRCALFTLPALHGAMARTPEIGLVLLRRLALRVRTLVERLDDRASRSVQARLIEFLLARPIDSTGIISLGMSQQKLAEELGTVREVVGRELARLCDIGIIARIGTGRYTLVRHPVKASRQRV